MKLSKQREQELLQLYGTFLGGSVDLGSYTDFDGLVECEDALSYEEFEWMNENYTASAVIKFERKIRE